MLQNLRNFAKISKFRLDNLVDLKKCWKTRIFLQRSVPIEPKTSEILPKICQSAVVPPRRAEVRKAASAPPDGTAGRDLQGRPPLHRFNRFVNMYTCFLHHPKNSHFGPPNFSNFGSLVLGCIEAYYASKYSCCSIFQALQDLRSFAPLQS